MVRFNPRPSIVAATVAALVLITGCAPKHSTGGGTPSSVAVSEAAASAEDVRQLVAASTAITTVPDDLTPSLSSPGDEGFAPCAQPKKLGAGSYCVYGDATADRTIILFGDSRAAEWTWGFDLAAKRAHYKVLGVTMAGCRVPDLLYYSDELRGPNNACSDYHRAALPFIVAQRPDILVLTNSTRYYGGGDGQLISPSKYRSGYESTLRQLAGVPAEKTFILGDYATLKQPAPDCLAAHESDVQACSESLGYQSTSSYRDIEQQVARRAGVNYIDTLPWTCATRCSPVIGKYLTYKDAYHMSAAYTQYLSGVLAKSLGLRSA